MPVRSQFVATNGFTLRTWIAGSGVTLDDSVAGQLTINAAGSGVVNDGDYGDITVSASGTVWTIDADVISTYGRTLTVAANAAAARTVLGLGSAAVENTSAFDAAGSAAAALVTANAYTDSEVAALSSVYQPLDATLTALAALTIAANSVTIGTGADAFSQVTLAANTFLARGSTGNLEAKTVSDFALSFFDAADAEELRTAIGVAAVGEETPAGSINGSNAVFTLSVTPTLLMLWKNGVKQRAGGGNDYTLSGSTITFEAGAIPQSGDTLDAVIFS